ncbi:hypothetical protein FRC12_014401 [Ceratobasidium sp. 428]|nr:hypothetical protein FRC12_014401 [Ceratobasidium sp. 428]
MLFGRALATLVVSLMATLVVAAPANVAANTSANVSLANSASPSSASLSVHSIISEARSDLGSIMTQLDNLDFEKNGTQAISQITTQLQAAVVHFVGNVVTYAHSEEGRKVSKRNLGGILGLDPIGLVKDAGSVVNEVFAIINRVKQFISQPAQGPEIINQIGKLISDILGEVSKALPTVISIVLRIINAAR